MMVLHNPKTPVAHWSLIVLDNKQCQINYIDSLGVDGQIYCSKLLEFIHLSQSKIGKDKDCYTTKIQSSPQQNNGTDCGVYAMVDAKIFLKENKI